ncbi:hypothetical protein FXF51_27095 [Nonomuraea sp. PA05]|uniref:hypothetical protein n=1 Tax=Nonomuraea sp. PA05 TaxID=2604466 RepID=UPI0011D2FE33|nr:hypothetical protein [Nonomuraea sp. PA05]TYB61749.1 hypothetical protein FXF51_27095 [Nonomuraea sp. PA05]
MSRRTIMADWAVWSKPPRSSDDYGIVGSSRSPGEHVRFEQLIRLADPGTPHGRREGAVDALPWVTFSAPEEGGDGRRWSAIAVREWSQEVDVSGRAILPTRYYTFPYDDGAATGAGYRDLYEAVLRAPSPALNGRRLSLELPHRDDPGGPGSTQGEPRWCAGVAALLLGGPVVVTGAPPLSPLERLDCMDAVTMFLPYGVRATLTASTWTDNATDHPIRLMFGRWAGPRQQEVRWAQPPPRPCDEYALSYLRWLLTMLDQAPDVLRRRLGGLREPLEFGSPGLRAVLEEQHRTAMAVLHRLREGATAGEQRAAALDPSFDKLTGAQRDELLCRLAERAQPEDLTVLAAHWPAVAPITLAVAGRRLAGHDQRPARAFLSLADRHGGRDDWLAGLLGQPGVPQDATIALLADEDPPGRRTCAALLARPHVLYLLIARLATEGSAERLRAWVLRCAGDGSDTTLAWLTAFAAVLLSPPEPPPEPALTHLHGLGGDVAFVVLLRAAAGASHAQEVLLHPSLYGRLLALARGPACEAREELAKVLSGIGPVPAEAGARLDVLAVLLGGAPRFATEVDHHAAERYAASFEQVWDDLPDRRLSQEVTRLIVAPLDHRHPLLNELERREKATEIVVRQRFDANPAVRSLMGAAEDDAPPATLAALWARALASVGPGFDPGPLLARWSRSHDSRALHELLRHLWQEAVRHGEPSTTGYRRLMEILVHHPGAPHYAAWIREQIPGDVMRLRAELDRLRWLLEIARAGPGAGPSPPVRSRLLWRLHGSSPGRWTEAKGEDA